MSDPDVRENEGLSNKQVFKSVALHVAIISFFTINAYLFPSEDLNFENAIRVDIVGLPEKIRNLPPPNKAQVPAKPTTPKSEPVPKVESMPTIEPAPVIIDEKKTNEIERKKAQKKALDKLKALEAISAIEEDVKTEAEKKDASVAGNQVSQGSALTGIRQNQISSYISQVKDHVNKNWSVPQWMADAKLRTEALVFLGSDGVVIRRLIVKTSGNSSFDDSILSAIDQSSPFPPPPSALVGMFKNKGFTLGFPE